ncbi:hypothetical protein FWK35_00030354 [Aphis craccivora]|uniref:Uncharacterized protein n=1 Tax=Aphis craccivora TaxID=307492 RepID=A0A6G0YAE1_APHCR|nr:hypothetical protein FWK35_00030354 [Aphis craccivora]
MKCVFVCLCTALVEIMLPFQTLGVVSDGKVNILGAL